MSMREEERRRRQLASDHRAGRAARLMLRQRHREVLLRSRLLLAKLVLGGFSLTAVSAALQRTSFLRGAIVGGGVVATLGGVAFLVVLTSGTAPTLMGETAEQWTAQSLRPLLKHGWRLVNHVPLAGGDVDHVLIGPDGVIVVETKWSRDPWALTERDVSLSHALRQVTREARSLRLLLEAPTQVRRVVVLWGGASEKLKDATGGRAYDGVTVIAGTQLEDWALRLGRGQLSDEEIDRIWARLTEYLAASDPYEARTNPVPEALGTQINRVVGAVAFGLVAVVALSYAARAPGGLLTWASGSLVASAAVLVKPLRRRHPLGTLAVSTAAAGFLVMVLGVSLIEHF